MDDPLGDQLAMLAVPLTTLAVLVVDAIEAHRRMVDAGGHDVRVRLLMAQSGSVWGMRRWGEGALTVDQAIDGPSIERDARQWLADHPAEMAEYEQMLAAYADEQVRGE
jgi:hypothetical protein